MTSAPPVPAAPAWSAHDWRRALLQLTLRVSLVLGTLVYVPSVYLSLVEGMPWVVVADTVAIAGVWALRFAPGLSDAARAALFGAICYLVGATLLMFVGPVSQAYLMGTSLLMTLLLGQRAGMFCVGVNGATLLALGLVGRIAPDAPGAAWDLGPWLVVTANFVFVDLLLVLVVGIVIRALESSLAQERSARAAAEEERAEVVRATAARDREAEERREADAAREESERRFREIAENIRDIFYNLDAETGALSYVSPAFRAVWGHDDVANWRDAVHPEDRPGLDAALARRNAGEAVTVDYRIVRPDGELRWIQDSGYPVLVDGRIARIVGTARDITDQRRLEEQFLRAQRMEGIGTLAGGIAHDLNNVLSPILLSTEMLKHHVRGRDAEALVDTVEDAAGRGADLIRQLLVAVRGTAGRRVDVEPVEAVEAVLRIVRDTFPRNIAIETPAARSPWRVNADPTQLQQVLMNLCVNARDAMPDGGRLSMTVRHVGADAVLSHAPGVVIRVEDTGSGMPRDVQERIFEPFFTTKELGRGTGLGLSTTWTIVKNHGGAVRVYSEVGRGTAFEVHLPLSEGSDDAQEPEAPAVTRRRGRGERILVVDDEPHIRTVTEAVLVGQGYRVLLAADGAEGLAVFEAHRDGIAVVITDMSMPRMDGPSMVAALRALAPGVRIVGTSGLTTSAEVTGLDRFLPKPVTPDALFEALGALLGPDDVPAPSRVLVVEDEPALARVVERVLRRAGHDVVGVTSGERALAALDDGGFSLVVSDVRLPGMSGAELYARSRERAPGLRFVFTTGADDVPEALRDAVGDELEVLHKPFDSAGLVSVVDRALSR